MMTRTVSKWTLTLAAWVIGTKLAGPLYLSMFRYNGFASMHIASRALTVLLLCSVSGHCIAQALDERAVKETARRTMSTEAEVREAVPAGCESGIGSLMNLCAEYHYIVDDVRLNDAYKDLHAKLRGTRSGELLVLSQRAWIAYRDSTCDFERERSAVLDSISCKQEITIDRTRWLESTYAHTD
jgi:uncharacterized protein YecT (DUF1311 family)